MDPEHQAAEAAVNAYLASNPGAGDTSDGMRYYQTLRDQGMPHDQALSTAFSQLGWGTPSAPASPTTPAAPSAPAAPTGTSDYDFNQARANIERALGRALSDADVASAFQRFGGNISGRFTDASIAPVISWFKSGAGSPTGPAGPGGAGPGGPGTYGGYPDPYASDPNAPQYNPLPNWSVPTWTGGDFVNPTEAEVIASPGYATRLNAGLQARERGAAARGTILSGGTAKALDRYGQDYAANEYQQYRNNSYDAYKEKYSHYQDAVGYDLTARTMAANENNNTFQNRTSTYNSNNQRTLSDYITNITNRRNTELDYWNRLKDLQATGASAAGGSYRP